MARVAHTHEAPEFERESEPPPPSQKNRAETSCGLAIRPLDTDNSLNQQIPPRILLGLSSSFKGIKESNGLTAYGCPPNTLYGIIFPPFFYVREAGRRARRARRRARGEPPQVAAAAAAPVGIC